MTDDFDSFVGFDSFGGFGRRRDYFPPLPTDIYLLGENSSNVYVPFVLDSDQRLLLKCVSRLYYSSTVKTIPSGTAGLLISAPTDDYVKNLIGVDIVNTSASDVTCYLYCSTSPTPSASHIFGICGWAIKSHSLWSWRGQLTLETKSIYGLAGASSSLRAYFSLAATLPSYR
jgi:hypothetical protein